MGGSNRAGSDGSNSTVDAEGRFRELYDRHVRAIRAYCTRRVERHLVDDVVAETFLTAWRRIADVPEGCAELPWLYRVAYRVVGHQWRADDRRRRIDRRMASMRRIPGPTPDDAVVLEHEVGRVLAATATLNPSDAEILRLVAWEQLSNVDIATVLDLEPNAVGQRLHRARKNLARSYDRLESDIEASPAAQKGGAR